MFNIMLKKKELIVLSLLYATCIQVYMNKLAHKYSTKIALVECTYEWYLYYTLTVLLKYINCLLLFSVNEWMML